jgi:hypothetical protein
MRHMRSAAGRLAFVLVLALLAGCGPSAQWVNRDQGITADQLKRDESQCMFGATEAGAQGPRVNIERFERCMADRGYTREKVAQ